MLKQKSLRIVPPTEVKELPQQLIVIPENINKELPRNFLLNYKLTVKEKAITKTQPVL